MPKQPNHKHCIFNAHKINVMLSFSNKNDALLLTQKALRRYRFSVAPQWVTGRENPYQSKATQTPIASFLLSQVSTPYSAEQIRTVSMVALAGQLSGWPVPFDAGILTPVSVTTNHERENSGGDSLNMSKEIIIMMTTPVPSYPQFVWLFLAIRRSDASARPHREEVTAPTYQAARRVIAREFIASFAGRLPVREVAHV